jgi:hypothetical protein
MVASSEQAGYSELRCSALAWMFYYNKLSFNECMNAIDDCNWWCKTEVLKHIKYGFIGDPSARHLLTTLTTDSSPDVSVLASYRIISLDIGLDSNVTGIRTNDADTLLKAFGLIQRRSKQICGVSVSLRRMLGSDPFYTKSWRSVLNTDYDACRHLLVEAAGKLHTSYNEWVNLIDAFNDLFLDVLYKHDNRLGLYERGKIGSVIYTSKKLMIYYPSIAKAFIYIHDLRLDSDLSHAYNKSTRKRTRRIKYREALHAATLLKLALDEASSKW